MTILAAPFACSPLPQPVVVEDDGGWCWFQDERALALGDVVVVGSVASGRCDRSRRGDVQATFWWPASGRKQRVVLHPRLEVDDHDAPALLRLPDGRLLAAYARHGGDRLARWRRTRAPLDFVEWEPERRLEVPAARGVTYANPVHLADGDVVLNFCRAQGWDPTVLESRDHGATFTVRGRLLAGPGRPYVIYAGNGRDAVHFVATEQHPRDFDNSLYHGVLRGEAVLDSHGEVRGALGRDPPPPERLTRIFAGRPDAVAWPADLELDAAGRPVVLYTVQVDGAGLPPGRGGMDHRVRYARFDGVRWWDFEIAFAGRRLYAGEDDYTGLGAIDPEDPMVVYVSTDAHPRTGAPLVGADGRRHREIFWGRTSDGGATWRWRPITRDSTADNLRPIVPRGRPRVLLWLRGELRTYRDYDLEIVALPLGAGAAPAEEPGNTIPRPR